MLFGLRIAETRGVCRRHRTNRKICFLRKQKPDSALFAIESQNNRRTGFQKLYRAFVGALAEHFGKCRSARVLQVHTVDRLQRRPKRARELGYEVEFLISSRYAGLHLVRRRKLCRFGYYKRKLDAQCRKIE